MALLYRFFDLLRRCRQRSRGPQDFATGRHGEDLAHRFLRRNGFTVVARNYRPRTGSGEIDLIAWEKDQLVFIEVKSRSTDDFGTPDRAVNREKQEHVIRTARDYALRSRVDWDHVRFDIVTVLFGNHPKIALQRDAFARHLHGRDFTRRD
jgi:putative endonuclease